MKIAYFYCFAWASGDMTLGAVVDAGLGLKQLKNELAKLRLIHYDLEVRKVVKKGVSGSQAVVLVDGDHHHLRDIEQIIEGSDLEESVKLKSIKIFRRLAESESRVHQTTIDEVHFHEVGAMDAVIDTVGAVTGRAVLGIEKILCSPLHVGTGTVECADGILPVQAPGHC